MGGGGGGGGGEEVGYIKKDEGARRSFKGLKNRD